MLAEWRDALSILQFVSSAESGQFRSPSESLCTIYLSRHKRKLLSVHRAGLIIKAVRHCNGALFVETCRWLWCSGWRGFGASCREATDLMITEGLNF